MVSMHSGDKTETESPTTEKSRVVSSILAKDKTLANIWLSKPLSWINDRNLCAALGGGGERRTLINADPMVEVRTIQQLSFPKNDSVNSAFITESVPKLRYESVVVIAVVWNISQNAVMLDASAS